tara:strand:- start:63159 stop:64301 length:1143 start_codon:yes stop_codon:yes gene_type:complete
MMKFSISKIITALQFMVALPCAAVSLFPEDGSQAIGKWYYSEKEIRYLYEDDKEWEGVLNAFESEGIQPINSRMGSFFQDLAFFDTEGRLILQHFPKRQSGDAYEYREYFGGFTQEVYMPWDWDHEEEVNLLTKESSKKLGLESIQLKYAFIEGGATITGKFKNGDDYLLINESSLISIHKYYKDKISEDITKEEVLRLLEQDFSLRPGNFIVLNGTSSHHLDTFIKALPGGRILVDSPDIKISLLKDLMSKTNNPEIGKYLKGEQELINQDHYDYKVIRRAKKQLDERFEVIDVAGVFSRVTPINGHDQRVTDVNFFNGVSGSNESGGYFITNKAKVAPELEKAWKEQLKSKGVPFDRYHFVGRYKGAAGLDCMGSPSP